MIEVQKQDLLFAELLFEARLTWHLDRLVFSDQEVSLERLQGERDAAERKLVDHVLERLALWQRSRVRAADEEKTWSPI